MQLKRYFDRIGYRGTTRPGIDVLRALQKSHVCSVPFENLDVQLERSLTTEVDAAYEKIVTRRRGGWCYEQNGLFGWALTQIGFDVTRISANVMRQKKEESSADNHLCLLVKTPDSNGEYLVDVGFGGSMLEPVPLAEAEYSQPPFRIGLRALHDGYWRFWEDFGHGEFSYDFAAETADESALARRCEYLQSDPSSGFVLKLVAQLRGPDSHKTLRGRIFTVNTPNGRRSETLPSAEALLATLSKEFRLDVPEVAGLWPRITARHEEFLREKTNGRQATARPAPGSPHPR